MPVLDISGVVSFNWRLGRARCVRICHKEFLVAVVRLLSTICLVRFDPSEQRYSDSAVPQPRPMACGHGQAKNNTARITSANRLRPKPVETHTQENILLSGTYTVEYF